MMGTDQSDAEAQAETGLQFSGHPQDAVNRRPFRRSLQTPEANGFPHFDNGAFHLYVTQEMWRLTAAFDPSSPGCWSYISPASNGAVPVGEQEWCTFQNDKWEMVKVVVNAAEPQPSEIDCMDIIQPLLSSASDAKRFLTSDPTDGINAKCVAEGSKFVDADFPPDDSSLKKAGDLTSPVCTQWIRASELCESPVIYDEDMRDDVAQGSIGDCYMCTVFANVSFLRPELIKAVFSGRGECNPHGCYTLRLCDPRSSEWRYVVVDDYIPTHNGKPGFLFSKNGNELWCALLEKALAKLAGSYARLDARGVPMKNIVDGIGSGQVMMMLTGAVGGATFVPFAGTAPQSAWDQMSQALTYKWPTTASCSEVEVGQQAESQGSDGLVHHHSYSVIGAVEMPGGARLVRVRNPWGKFEWNGAWSDGDAERWTVEAREFVKEAPISGGELADADDGAFFLPLEVFLKEFRGFEFCVVKGDGLWEQYRSRTEAACREQGGCDLRLQGHPKPLVNQQPFKRSAADPDASGRPHWENGRFHLVFSEGHWRIQGRFKPDSTGCWSYIAPAADGTVPEGAREWTCCVNGKWVPRSITVTREGGEKGEGEEAGGGGDAEPEAQAEAEAEAEEAEGEAEGAVDGDAGALAVAGHFMEGVNAQPFARSDAAPEANGRAHYENGTFHLYFAGGCWRLQSVFTPESNGCWSYVGPAGSGGVPEGTREWTSFVDGAWRGTMLTVTRQ